MKKLLLLAFIAMCMAGCQKASVEKPPVPKVQNIGVVVDAELEDGTTETSDPSF